MTKTLDLGTRNKGLGKVLSNFSAFGFTLDDVVCGSMEGFLQSLKQEGLEEQETIAALVGYEAYSVGQLGSGWKETQTLYWRGEALPRFSKKYHQLIERAYDTCFASNDRFREALLETGADVLTHVIGSHDPTQSVLTEWEYIYNMYRLRALAQQLDLGLI